MNFFHVSSRFEAQIWVDNMIMHAYLYTFREQAEQLFAAAKAGDIETVIKLLQSATASEVNHKKVFFAQLLKVLRFFSIARK